jgi:hypothetical protein
MIFLTDTSQARMDFDDLETATGLIHPTRSPRGLERPQAAAADGETFHSGPTLTCSHCHVMHASQEHGYDNTEPDPFGAFPRTFTPSAKLLKATDPVALCLTCHDNVAGIPDVVGADVNGLTERSAGLFDAANEDNPRGHKLEYGLATGGGFDLCMRCHFAGTFATASVTCIDCHNPHGNGRPRNLQWASDPGGEPQFGYFENPGSHGLDRYEAANVAYGTTDDAALREVSNMCLDCHHVISGQSYIDPDGDGIHELHPTYDSERGSTNNIAQGAADMTTDPAHWEDGTGAGFLATSRLRFVNAQATDYSASLVVDATVNGVFCLSCHKAHGSQHAFSLRWDPSSGINGEGCDQCHNKTQQ